ncbi:MAG: AEC family transporter [Oscillospiraceae bacterium]|nr:AEC family transporter [Oscillospiraceae bacterium]
MEALHILVTAANAVLPIVLLILLGYWLRQTGFLSAEFVKTGNKLVFNVCLPCMLFINVYDIEGFESISWDIVIYSMVMVFGIFLLGMLIAVLTTKQPKRRGAISQAVFRSNMAIIGLSLASALGGNEAVAAAAIVSAFTVPLFNVLAVFVLTYFSEDGSKGKTDFKKIFLNIAKNPLIISIALGMVCLAIRSFQTKIFGTPVFQLKDIQFLYKALNNLKSIASPFALLVLGGQFTFSAVKALWKEIVSGTLGRIVLAPLVGIGAAVILSNMGIIHCGVNEFPALIALFGSPTAVSSAVMAGQMGADEQLATQLVVWTSIVSIFTVFGTVCILMSMGLLAV